MKPVLRNGISSLPDDPVAAESRLEAFLRNWPKSPLSADAALQLGELARERGDGEAALQRFYFVLRKFPRSRRVDSARLGVALLEYERSNGRVAERDGLIFKESHETAT